jgi:predicted transcriptional regulator
MHLGDLEKKVMRVIWSYPEKSFTVRDIMERVGETYAYNTILTVMTHLYEKKLLKRRKKGRSCVYSVKVDRSSFVRRASRTLFETMKKEHGSLAIAHFADLVEDIDPAVVRAAKESLSQKK